MIYQLKNMTTAQVAIYSDHVDNTTIIFFSLACQIFIIKDYTLMTIIEWSLNIHLSSTK